MTLSKAFEKVKPILRDTPFANTPKDPSGGKNPKLRLRPPLVPKPPPFEQVPRKPHDSHYSSDSHESKGEYNGRI